MTLADPITTPSGSPLGRFGSAVAALIALGIVGAAILVHVAVAFGLAHGTDPFLDNASLIVIGVVLGVGAIGGTAAAAHAQAAAANRRLDAIHAPPANGTV